MTRIGKFVRQSMAVALALALVPAILITAQRENLAAHSPKKRSDLALQKSVADNMKPAQLEAFARQIAITDPMHAAGFFLQVMARDIRKLPTTDDRRLLIAEAARRQPSFAAPRIWLVADDIRMRRFHAAINGSDAVMRVNGEFRRLLIPILVPLLAEPSAFPLLVEKLREFPVWRTDFLAEAAKQGGFAAQVEKTLLEPVPATYSDNLVTERSAYLQRLVANGEADRAYRLWRRFAPGQAGVIDGTFKQPNTILPFGWRFASEPFSYAEKTKPVDGDATVTRAYHSGDGRVSLLTQLVALRGGDHRVSFQMRSGGLEKPEGLFWKLRCLDATEDLATLSVAAMPDDWKNFTMPVNVPDANCSLQYLRLEAGNNGGAEYEVEIRKVEAD
jgi:hypothetical protein